MNQMVIPESSVNLPLTDEMYAFIQRYEVEIDLVQHFQAKPVMWAITRSKYNMHNRGHVEMHDKILKAINGVG